MFLHCHFSQIRDITFCPAFIPISGPSFDFSLSNSAAVVILLRVVILGLKNYYAFLCDDKNNCSSSMAGNFQVTINHSPGIPSQPQGPTFLYRGETGTYVSPVNDPFWHTKNSWPQSYDDLWGLKRIKIEEAWKTQMGSAETIVAIVDSVVDYNHPEIAANIWLNTRETPDNGIDDDGNA